MLRPSSASRWINCHASVRMATYSPSVSDNTAAEEGIAAHWLAEQLLTRYVHPSKEVPPIGELKGSLTPNSILITDDMLDAVQQYSNDVFKYCNKTDGLLRKVNVEQEVPITKIHKDMKGTPDAWVHDVKNNELVIWDFKYGHTFVDAYENWQLITYATGILDHLHIKGLVDQYIRVKLRIVQPRCYSNKGIVREWDVVASELRPYVNQLESAAALAMLPDSAAKTGKHCRYCTTKTICTAYGRSAYEAFDYVSSTGEIHQLEGHNLSTEIRLLRDAKQIIESRLGALEEQGLHSIKNGKDLPGLTAVQSYGRERWKPDTPHAEVIMMGEMLGIDLKKPVQLDTPAQARKKGIDESVIKAYSIKPKSTVKLIEDDGKKANRIFK